MKIVSWNCGGALRNKLSALTEIPADVFVLQECENPALSKNAHYAEWARNSIWIGNQKNKGLAVVAKDHISLKHLAWDGQNLESFIPCLINDEITMLAVWTKRANSPNFGYIGQLWKYLQLHKEKLPKSKALVVGDWNSNSCWDEWDRWWNHSDVVRELQEIGISSLYHHQYQQSQGAETQPTFYLYRKLSKPYHIDYVFLSEDLLASSQMEIGKPETWLALSDHMPIEVDIPHC
jgi:endonuclease/exonuclease/phosphatase family metal-dependent hydrolase